MGTILDSEALKRTWIQVAVMALTVVTTERVASEYVIVGALLNVLRSSPVHCSQSHCIVSIRLAPLGTVTK
jgi:hypothetical protein